MIGSESVKEIESKTEQIRKSHSLLSCPRYINLYISRKNAITRPVSEKGKKHRWYCTVTKEVVLSTQRSYSLVSLQIENAITFEKLQEWTSSNLMEEKTVKVYLPRMKMEEKYNLTSVLMGLGITDLFSSSADLSGISSVERLKVSEAVHQAFVEVDEAGSEAAGIAGAAVKDESASPEFKVDHPFLFLIRHNPTDGILFLARCISP